MDIPDDVALEKQFAHHALVDTVDLANLCQLQSTWCTGEQEADDNENWIVQDADWDVFRGESKERRHDNGWEQHARDERSDHQLSTDLVLLGIWVERFLRKGIAGKVGAQNDQNERNGNTS